MSRAARASTHIRLNYKGPTVGIATAFGSHRVRSTSPYVTPSMVVSLVTFQTQCGYPSTDTVIWRATEIDMGATYRPRELLTPTWSTLGHAAAMRLRRERMSYSPARCPTRAQSTAAAVICDDLPPVMFLPRPRRRRRPTDGGRKQRPRSDVNHLWLRYRGAQLQLCTEVIRAHM